MNINLTEFYDIGEVTYWKSSTGVTLYDIELISKSTGEVIIWSFTEEYFDKFIKEIEIDNMLLQSACISLSRERKNEQKN